MKYVPNTASQNNEVFNKQLSDDANFSVNEIPMSRLEKKDRIDKLTTYKPKFYFSRSIIS